MNYWEHCKDWIASALEYADGTHNLEDIRVAVASGQMQLWPHDRGCAVTEIVLYPQKKVLHVFLAGGELDAIIGGLSDLEKWAISQGCASVTLMGRKGWGRVLASHGFKSTLTFLERRIE